MKNTVRFFLAGAAAAAALMSCQDVFTTSAFSFIETDMSTMTSEQKITYAEDLLSSGTAEQLSEAYTAIAALLPDDYATATDLTADELDLVILAADLAVGASGIGTAITEMVSVVSSVDTSSDTSSLTTQVTEILSSVNTENLQSAVDLITAAEANGAELSSEQYANAAAAQALIVIDNAGGIDNVSSIDPDDPDLAQALEWAAAANVDMSSLLGEEFALP